MSLDVSYKDYRKSNDIHGSVLYPAVMVAPVQKLLLEKLIEDNNISSIFDPFHGSGTALYEAMEISKDISLVGCDINPLANLITTVKLQGVSSNIKRSFARLKRIINKKSYKLHNFYNINKWFRDDIITDLSILRSAIIKINNKQDRLFFWYMLCDIIRKYSNTRSSTYKLHIKEEGKIINLTNNLIDTYLYKVENNISRFNNNTNNFTLYKCDILDKIREFQQNSFDISITSPPYGDNSTTVPYGQFSMLPLYWIDKKDLNLDGWELNNYSIIDSKSIGGSHKDIEFSDYENNLLRPYIKKICDRKKKKVRRFFADYFIFMRELCRVTDKYIVMTLGNRTVDGVNINLTRITQKLLENYGYEKVKLMIRKIPNKRMPKRVSTVNNKSVSSMNKEYIIIYKKAIEN